MRFVVSTDRSGLPIRLEPDGTTVAVGEHELLMVEWTADGGDVRHAPDHLLLTAPPMQTSVRTWIWTGSTMDGSFEPSPGGAEQPVLFTVTNQGPAELSIDFEPDGMPAPLTAGQCLTVAWQGDRGEIHHSPDILLVGTPSVGLPTRTRAWDADGEEVELYC
jgi:hypothetical protein